MSILGSLPPQLGLFGVAVDAALKVTEAVLDKKNKEERLRQENKSTVTRADSDSALLEGARDKGLLTPVELLRHDLLKSAFTKIHRRTCNIIGKITECACKDNAENQQFINSVCSILDNTGVPTPHSEPLIEKLRSKDKDERAQAAQQIRKLIQINLDSVSKIKVIVAEATELNKRTNNKIGGVEKVKDSVERYEKHVAKLVLDFRVRKDDAPKRLIQNEKTDPKPEVKEVPKPKIAIAVPEDKTQEKSETLHSHTLMINETVESLQKVKELLVDIEVIKQEIDFLHSRVKPFEDPDFTTGEKLAQLEEQEEEKRNQLNFHLAQSSWRSLN